jgi:hypothetical protein
MKKYNLIVLAGHTHWNISIFGTTFSTQTNSSTSSGFYAFYDRSELVACYPIERTIISSIEDADE